MALDVVLGRAIPVIPLPTFRVLPTLSLPLPSGFPHQDSSSSSVSQSSSSSVSQASTSTSSSASESTSLSTTSSTTDTIPPSTSSEPPVTVTPTHTVTAIASDASPSSSSVAGPPQTSFLQNKVLSGVVFGIAGLVGLVLIILLATFAIRRRRNKKLVEDAVSFDPVVMGNYHGSMESGLGEKVRTSVSTGHGSNGPEVRQSPAFIDYAPPPNRSYLPPSADMPSYASHLQGQYNATGQPYTSTYDRDQRNGRSTASFNQPGL
ncbi:hypothetical protein M413DRAFT_23816 [Hebeloma cylindrosporum]|uniref:Mid2 domain-containing protein n=1 Tax=Hebeloma cylindrosporum TaxID=76867 RepID=A0A0C3CPI7_HEBCY|nr:hypothetical protein M413DRAFT_23816 [Hebeloma cylindrosporum h7]